MTFQFRCMCVQFIVLKVRRIINRGKPWYSSNQSPKHSDISTTTPSPQKKTHTQKKHKKHESHVFMMHHSSNAFSKHISVPKQASKLVIWTLWTCIGGFEYLEMTLTSAEITLIGTLLVHV